MSLALVLLVRMAFVGFPEIQEAVGQLLSRSGWLVGAAILVEALWTFSLANVYRSSLIAFGGRIDRSRAVGISMGAFSLSRILPGGGAAGSVFAAREMIRLDNPAPATVASMLVSWWFSMMTLALVVGLGTATGVAAGAVGVAHLAGPAMVAGVLLVLGGLVFAATRFAHLRGRVATGLSRAGARLGVVSEPEQWESLASSGLPMRRLVPLLGWASLSWIADAAALWLMFAGFGVFLHPAVLLVGYGLANLINALPEVTPGWLGVMEAALAAAYAGLGVPGGVAVVAVLCYRLVSYWLPVAAGLGMGLRMLRSRPGPEGAHEARRLEAVA
jgi:uncharacterized membrane protein YbhN (UPF0104 family)